MAKQRKIPLRAKGRTTKHPFDCRDGPMIGHTLWLVSSNTLTIKYKGQVGFYDSGRWHGVEDGRQKV